MEDWHDQIIANTEELKYLQEKNSFQNGSIERIENKMDRLETLFSTKFLAIQEKQEDINKYLRRTQWTIILLLISVIVNIITKRGVTNLIQGVLL